MFGIKKNQYLFFIHFKICDCISSKDKGSCHLTIIVIIPITKLRIIKGCSTELVHCTYWILEYLKVDVTLFLLKKMCWHNIVCCFKQEVSWLQRHTQTNRETLRLIAWCIIFPLSVLFQHFFQIIYNLFQWFPLKSSRAWLFEWWLILMHEIIRTLTTWSFCFSHSKPFSSPH